MDEYDLFADRLKKVITADDGAVARGAFKEYFSTDAQRFTGSQFEFVTERETPNTITARDIVAVSMLSVSIPARPARWLLSDEGSANVTALLEQVPTNVEIFRPEAEALLAPNGPMWDLWEVLATAYWPVPRLRNGLGGTTLRSKLLHAKRPRLVPIYDSVVEGLLPRTPNHWEAFRRALSDPETRNSIEYATSCAPFNLSLLRRVDIVLWHIGKQQGMRGGDGVDHDSHAASDD